MKSGWIVLGITAVAVASLVGFLHGPTGGDVPQYRVARVERGRIAATVSASGTLNPVVTVQVGSQLSGQIKAIHVDYNSPVKKGAVIARIAPETYESKVNQATADVQNVQGAVLGQRALVERARAEVENARGARAVAEAQTAKARVAVVDARRDMERKSVLLDKGLIARSERDTAQAVYDSAVAQLHASQAQERIVAASIQSAEAQLEAAQAQLQSALAAVEQRRAALAQAQLDVEQTLIRAPVDGIVISRNVDVGQTVAASLQAPTLFTIAQDLTRMQVETSLLEADIGRVKVGQKAVFTVDAFPRTAFHGTVVQIRRAPHVEQGVVSYNVIVSAENPDLRLLPGMTANVTIVTAERHGALKVPLAALRVRLPADGRSAVDRDEAGDRAPDRTPAAAAGREDTRRGHAGRVFVLSESGEPRALDVRVGVADGTAVEVLSGELHQGQEVIVGLGDRRVRRGASRDIHLKL